MVLASGAAAAGWSIGHSGHSRIGALERRVHMLESSSSALTAERDRLKAERNRLEARLAALDRTPSACPEDTLSTRDAHLLAVFIVEYPCGWNVLEEPLQKPPMGSGRDGLEVDHLFFSALPISKAPREGPLTEITLDTWYDDADAEGDALPTIDAWIVEARTRMTAITESTIKTGSGATTIRKLAGTMTAFDEPRPALIYLWEFTGPDGVRRICEAFALDPGATITNAIERLVRSFRLPGG